MTEPTAHRVTWFHPDRPVEGNTVYVRTAPDQPEPDAEETRMTAALNETPAYVIGRFVDATQHHGDRVLELWDDDVYRTRSGALIARDEQVDDPDPSQWRVFELRDVTEEETS